MSAAPYIVGGVVVGGALVLLVRQLTKAPDASFCANVAQPLGRLVKFDIPPSWCGAIDGIVGALAAPLKELTKTYADRDAKNKQLNGAVDVPLTDEVAAVTPCKLRNPFLKPPAGSTGLRFLEGTVLRFKNGCVPFSGARGWEKCAPGTDSMVNALGSANAVCAKRDGAAPGLADLLTGYSDDPATDLAAGIVAGKKYPCASGQTPQVRSVHDTRDNSQTVDVKCGESYEQAFGGGAANTLPTPAAGTVIQFGSSDLQSNEHITDVSSHPGYHLVPATPTVPAHWERDR